MESRAESGGIQAASSLNIPRGKESGTQPCRRMSAADSQRPAYEDLSSYSDILRSAVYSSTNSEAPWELLPHWGLSKDRGKCPEASRARPLNQQSQRPAGAQDPLSPPQNNSAFPCTLPLSWEGERRRKRHTKRLSVYTKEAGFLQEKLFKTWRDHVLIFLPNFNIGLPHPFLSVGLEARVT